MVASYVQVPLFIILNFVLVPQGVWILVAILSSSKLHLSISHKCPHKQLFPTLNLEYVSNDAWNYQKIKTQHTMQNGPWYSDRECSCSRLSVTFQLRLWSLQDSSNSYICLYILHLWCNHKKFCPSHCG